ncbi:uncharacterized protein EDB91DRAFT_78053 [Suillus paluster]|uniref:uncharacterized protein n=1 Tax=Suillus paluster TaxID=48578 RepID=UPI001B872770|nr:uncharacterized protein EDB91DRAFT_78053 [Suillus paluster]KAG1726001.1 hypothetical protein EDB91DRAFT_78053 [Suillus paluster]
MVFALIILFFRCFSSQKWDIPSSHLHLYMMSVFVLLYKLHTSVHDFTTILILILTLSYLADNLIHQHFRPITDAIRYGSVQPNYILSFDFLCLSSLIED